MGRDTFSPSLRHFNSRCDVWRRVWWLRRFCSWPKQGPIVGFKLKINSKSNSNYWCIAHCVNRYWMNKSLFSLLFIMFPEKSHHVCALSSSHLQCSPWHNSWNFPYRDSFLRPITPILASMPWNYSSRLVARRIRTLTSPWNCCKIFQGVCKKKI